MSNAYIITAGAPLLRPGLTIMTEVSEKDVIRATRTLLTKVRGLNEEVAEVDKLKIALHHTEQHLKQEIARNKEMAAELSPSERMKRAMVRNSGNPSGPTLAEAAQPKPKPTTVRMKPRDVTNPYMPMTERYQREVDRRIRSKFNNKSPRR